MLPFDYLRYAVKNLLRQKVRTGLTIVAVIIGAASVVIMLSLVLGAKHVFLSQMETLGMLTQVTVTQGLEIENNDQTGQGAILDDETVGRLSGIAHVLAASPGISVWTFQAMELKDGGNKIRPQILAYEPGSSFDPPLIAGRNLEKDDLAKIVIGGAALRSFGYEQKPDQIIGKTLIMTTNTGYSGWGVDIPKPPANADQSSYWEELERKIYQIEAEIVGVAVPGPEDYQSYTNITWARQLHAWKHWQYDHAEADKLRAQSADPSGQDFWKLESESEIERRGYHLILLKVDDPVNVELVAGEIEKMGLAARTVKEILESLTMATNILGIILGAIGAISLGVAAIGIVNTMIMATYERTREIGVMRACGATGATVRRLFAFEAALLGFFGGLIGLAASFALAKIGNILLNQFAEGQGAIIRDVITFPWWLVAGVIIFTTLIGLFAGLYPAFRAARLNPVEALHYE